MNEVYGVVYMFSGVAPEIGNLPGYSTRLNQRPGEHITAALNGRHTNKNFQEAVNQYGIDSFICVVSEPIPYPQLAQMEQAMFELIKDTGGKLLSIQQNSTKAHPVGYQLSEETRKKQSLAKRGVSIQNNKKEYVFVSPDGEIVKVRGLKEFCEKNKLTMSQMSRVAAGKSKTHKKWRAANEGAGSTELNPQKF